MSIISFIKNVCVQDAVYWSPGADNGFGEKTWTATQISTTYAKESSPSVPGYRV